MHSPNSSYFSYFSISAAILLLISSCGKADKNESLIQNEILEGTSQKVYTGAGDDSLRYDYSKALQNPRTSRLARAIFYNKERWNLSDNDNTALALMDSLTADNEVYRPFYFKVVTTTYPQAEGLYADALGYMGTSYVLSNTHEFLNYFIGEHSFSRVDLQTWSKIVLLEISKTTGENLLKAVSDFNSTLKGKSYSPIQQKVLDDFTDGLERQAAELLKVNGE